MMKNLGVHRVITDIYTDLLIVLHTRTRWSLSAYFIIFQKLPGIVCKLLSVVGMFRTDAEREVVVVLTDAAAAPLKHRFHDPRVRRIHLKNVRQINCCMLL